jgi:hypothetical protein
MEIDVFVSQGMLSMIEIFVNYVLQGLKLAQIKLDVYAHKIKFLFHRTLLAHLVLPSLHQILINQVVFVIWDIIM